jgi:hypothetical protein
VHAADIYVAGNSAGVEEASTAMEEGRRAGLDAAVALGFVAPTVAEETAQQIEASLQDLRRGPFGRDRARAKEEVVAAYARTFAGEKG